MTPAYPQPRSILRQVFAFATCSSLMGSLAIAQSAPKPAKDSDEQVVTLSPFEVRAETGWVATQTLAGSRLRTDLSDLAGQIETLTMEFMNDFAVTSVEAAAIYSLNMESRAEYVSGNGLMNNITGELRVRGLAAPTNSVEFFATNAPSDNYNIDRITIASGPNSILFGAGSPAGVVDSSLKRALMTNSGSIGFQMDSFGGRRAQFDLNRKIIGDVLAVRVASVYDETQWDVKESRETDKRVYGTVTYQPFRNTTVRAHVENFSIWTNRPSRLYPFDAFTPWYDADRRPTAGYPSRHVFQNSRSWQEGVDRNGDGDTNDAGETPPFFINGELFQTQGAGYPTVVGGSGVGAMPLQSWANTLIVRPPNEWLSVPAPFREADGYTVLDNSVVPTDVNFAANMKTSELRGTIAHAFVTQKIVDNMFLEVGFRTERNRGFDNLAMDYLGALNVQVDVNAFLPDGVTPNPHLGRLYLRGIRPAYSRPKFDKKDMRAALSYEFDFAQRFSSRNWLVRNLGRHRLAGLASRSDTKAVESKLSYVITPDANGVWPFFPGVQYPNVSSPTIDLSNRIIAYRYYLSEDDWTPDLFYTPGKPITLKDGNGREFTMDAENTGYRDQFGRRLAGSAGGTFNKNRQDSLQFAYQGYFWNNRIIGTLGYREDRIMQAKVQDGFAEDSYTRLRPHPDDVTFEPFGPADRGITRTQGVVVDPLKGLLKLPFDVKITASYNESDTFQPNTTLYNPLGGTYPGAAGKGRDKGIALRTQDNRLIFRYTEFTNTAGPQRAANVPFNRIRRDIGLIETRMREFWPDMPEPQSKDNTVFPNVGIQDPYAVVSYRRAEGKEISLDWTPNRNWNFRLTYAKSTAIETNIGADWFNAQGTGWLDQRLPVWQSIDIPEGGLTNPRDVNRDGVIGRWNWDNLTYNLTGNGETMKSRYERIIVTGSYGLNIIKALDGKSNDFVRDNRVNFNALYRFTHGKLNGLRVGGAVRQRGKPLLNYGSTVVDGNEIIDLRNPIYGEQELFMDLTFRYGGKSKALGDRRYEVGLTVRNATDEGDIVTLYNGNLGPSRKARVDGRQFVLSFNVDI